MRYETYHSQLRYYFCHEKNQSNHGYQNRLRGKQFKSTQNIPSSYIWCLSNVLVFYCKKTRFESPPSYCSSQVFNIFSQQFNNQNVHKWSETPVPALNTLRTGDADLRFYVTTVQDGWSRFEVFNSWNSVHLQVLLSATPQGGMFPEVSHPQALIGS